MSQAQKLTKISDTLLKTFLKDALFFALQEDSNPDHPVHRLRERLEAEAKRRKREDLIQQADDENQSESDHYKPKMGTGGRM